LTFGLASAYANTDIKKVCHDVKYRGKLVHQCKNIKIHKKFEGTPIPEKK
jgi:hypothetical protein